jgi:hypothetical protein
MKILFYATMPFRAVAVGVAFLIILLASTMDGGIWDYCDVDHAIKIVVG